MNQLSRLKLSTILGMPIKIKAILNKPSNTGIEQRLFTKRMERNQLTRLKLLTTLGMPIKIKENSNKPSNTTKGQ
jgi:hypothetical protein